MAVVAGVLLEIGFMCSLNRPIYMGPVSLPHTNAWQFHKEILNGLDACGLYPTRYFWPTLFSNEAGRSGGENDAILFTLQAVFWGVVICALLTLLHHLKVLMRRWRVAKVSAGG